MIPNRILILGQTNNNTLQRLASFAIVGESRLGERSRSTTGDRHLIRIGSWPATLAIGAALVAASAHGEQPDRSQQGDWAVSDSTNNNTGSREVYAFQLQFEKGRSDWLSLYLRCSAGRPTFWVDWIELPLPDQAVLSIAVESAHSPMQEHRYVFEMSNDPVEHGLRASPEDSEKIVAAVGDASSIVITAYLTPSQRSMSVAVDGMADAWRRVVRHCPVQKLPVPPL